MDTTTPIFRKCFPRSRSQKKSSAARLRSGRAATAGLNFYSDLTKFYFVPRRIFFIFLAPHLETCNARFAHFVCSFSKVNAVLAPYAECHVLTRLNVEETMAGKSSKVANPMGLGSYIRQGNLSWSYRIAPINGFEAAWFSPCSQVLAGRCRSTFSLRFHPRLQ